MADGWDITAKVVGHGFELEQVIGGIEEPPDDKLLELVKRAAEEAFAFWFARQHETSAVTVGPHRAVGDDDDPVG
jgi:hypothetical protein